jgi:hypothetical protein
MKSNFEINSYLLIKMGWCDPKKILNLNSKILNKLYYVEFDPTSLRFFFDDYLLNTCYIIKQNEGKKYNFLVIDYSQKRGKVTKVLNINSNVELIKIISDLECCNDDYKRHFKLNKILKK